MPVLAHDAGHTCVTGNWWWDRMIGMLVANYIGGLSLGWWCDVRLLSHWVGPPKLIRIEPQHSSPRHQSPRARSRYPAYPLLCHLEAILWQLMVDILQTYHGLGRFLQIHDPLPTQDLLCRTLACSVQPLCQLVRIFGWTKTEARHFVEIGTRRCRILLDVLWRYALGSAELANEARFPPCQPRCRQPSSCPGAQTSSRTYRGITDSP
jgi:hypothetical protein